MAKGKRTDSTMVKGKITDSTMVKGKRTKRLTTIYKILYTKL
jgi:hypothetical protein